MSSEPTIAGAVTAAEIAKDKASIVAKPAAVPSEMNTAVANNAALGRMFFPEAPQGVLEAGAFADIIFVDYHPTTPLSAGNLPWHIVFGFESSMVTTTICGGRVLMRDRKLVDLDEAEITARSRELAAKVWERIAA